MKQQKVIVITGASSGIGLATAEWLVKKGHIVYGLARSKVVAKGVFAIQADVTDFQQLEASYKSIYETEGSIDVLINNAGMGIAGSVEETSIEDATYLYEVNVMGVFHSVKAALPYMHTTKRPKIINLGSVAGRFAIPFQAFYSSSKAAVEALSDALDIELKPYGFQVCTVLPGDIKTSFTQNRRKNKDESNRYRKRVIKSLKVMETDEQNGIDVGDAGKVVGRLALRRWMPLHKVIGFKYKVFLWLKKFLPTRLARKIVSLLYGFTHVKSKDE